MRVMGVDPGLAQTGIGVIEESSGRLKALAASTIVTPANGTPERLAILFDRLQEEIERWRPDSVAVERLFLKLNAKTAVPAIQAAGVALLAAARAGAPVYEYTPLKVKEAVVGVGSATKDQVGFMVQHLLGMPSVPSEPDSADALAVAICHLHAQRIGALQERSR